MQFLNVLAALLALQGGRAPAPTREVADAVVRLTDGEGHGSGILIDPEGYILTNAHVAGSPLPFTVEVETRSAEGRQPRIAYRKVRLAGFHPRRDLALVKIDPAEHGLKLKTISIRKSSPTQGESVFAVGYPGDVRAGNQLTMTRGRILSLAAIIHRREHVETDVSIWFGNSGGPLLDANGELVGVISMKNSTHGALCVPAWEIRPETFVPLKQRPPEPTVAVELSNEADAAIKEYERSGDGRYLALGIHFIHQAAVIDVGNEAHFSKLGAVYFLKRNVRSASAYLARALQINPWPERGIYVYFCLAECLATSGKGDDAVLVLDEGTRKYPSQSGPAYELLARVRAGQKRWEHAAIAARTAHRIGAEQPDVMNKILQDAAREMLPDEKGRTLEHTRNLDKALAIGRENAAAAHKERKPAMTDKFAAFMKGFDGVQQEGAVGGLRLGGGVSVAADVGKFSDEEVTTMFVRGQIAVAKEHLRQGRRAQGLEMLASIVKTYPGHPDSQEAAILLNVLEKQ